MNYLEKITINNARKFGENVEIDFGKGATIILAQNGIGKTTIFEAIELAFTGEINRLEKYLDAIIRDKSSKMNVRLDFTNDIYCQTTCYEGGICERDFNFKELFDVEDNFSVPYLYRLTHYYEQHSKNRFIEQNESDAGNLLSQLPIGKDLREVILKRTGLIRAIGNIENNAKREFDEEKTKYLYFKELLEKRNKYILTTKITTLEELIDKLRPISKLIAIEEFEDDFLITPISNYFQRVRFLVQQELGNYKNNEIIMSSLKERVQHYLLNLEMLKRKQNEIKENSKKIDEVKLVLEKNSASVRTVKESLLDINSEIKNLNYEKTLFDKLDLKKQNISIKKAEFESIKKELSNLQELQNEMVKELEELEKINNRAILIKSKIEGLNDSLIKTKNKKTCQKLWQETATINQELIVEKIPRIENVKIECLALKEYLDNQVSKAEKTYLTKKNTLESLNTAAGVIQEAISNIRANLYENQNFCPVCQAKYEPSELIERIESSLNKLNPSIPLAIEDEKVALKELVEVKDKQKRNYEQISKIQSDLIMLHNQVNENKRRIQEDFMPMFRGYSNAEEANHYIEEQMKHLEFEKSKFELMLRELDPQLTTEQMNATKLKISEDATDIKKISEKSENLESEVINETQEINIISEKLSKRNRDTISNEISIKLAEEKQKTKFLQDLELELAKNQEVLNETQNIIIKENEIISQLNGSQEAVFVEWKQAGLENKPNNETLQTKHAVVLTKIGELNEASEVLNTIDQELTNWRIAEELHSIEDEINKQKVEYNEIEYKELLLKSYKEKENRLSNIQEKKNALLLFLDEAASGSKKIHEQLNLINEPWKNLLKRIVINPLITSAPLLHNSSLRNKPIAKTSVNIHDKNIGIAKIASEAQLADLQLTLMLSMAKKYQWTSWKALLLDDPTQFHDLVHASSVFDVLRDYILDFNYQVLMSTHDSSQARFFQRKLENEGIESKIYRLVTRKEGVIAEQIS